MCTPHYTVLLTSNFSKRIFPSAFLILPHLVVGHTCYIYIQYFLWRNVRLCTCQHENLGFCPFTNITRHRASTSMYSLTFCDRFLLPERHQRKPAVQAAAVMLRTPPSTANHRRASHARFPYTARTFENAAGHPPVSGQQRAQTSSSRPFALCRHIAGWKQACH